MSSIVSRDFTRGEIACYFNVIPEITMRIKALVYATIHWSLVAQMALSIISINFGGSPSDLGIVIRSICRSKN